MNKEQIKQEIEKFCEPVNYPKLVKDGFLEETKTKNKYKLLKELPPEVGKRIVRLNQTKNGLYATFCSEKKISSFRKKLIR